VAPLDFFAVGLIANQCRLGTAAGVKRQGSGGNPANKSTHEGGITQCTVESVQTVQYSTLCLHRLHFVCLWTTWTLD